MLQRLCWWGCARKLPKDELHLVTVVMSEGGRDYGRTLLSSFAEGAQGANIKPVVSWLHGIHTLCAFQYERVFIWGVMYSSCHVHYRCTPCCC